MSSTNLKNIRNIGIVAHVDAGKTTMTEQMLYVSGAIRQVGSVDKKSSHMDWSSVEKQRGITIFSEQAAIEWKDTVINIIDTPGHIDFCSEVERTFQVLDGAVLIISAVEGVQAHTETIWNMLRKNNIPTLIFINKLDRVGADVNKVYESIKKNLTKDAVILHKADKVEKDFQGFNDLIKDKKYIWKENNNQKFEMIDYYNKEGKVEIIEKIADKDEIILNKYLEEEDINNDELSDVIRKYSKKCNIFPVFLGASLRGIGIEQLLDGIVDYIPSPSGNLEGSFSAVVYKIKIDDSIGKLAYVKILEGRIKVRDTIVNKEFEEEKVTQIRKYNGEKYTNVDELRAGEIGVLCGIKKCLIGDIFGHENERKKYRHSIISVLNSTVVPKNEEELMDILKCMEILNEEDPLLNLGWNSEKKEITINIMGIVQMEIIREIILQRFGYEIELEKPKVNYVETVKERSSGFCHFEPKKHFAEVEMEIEPNERGKGVEYTSKLSLDYLPSQYQNIIKKTITEAVKHGVLLGASVTDVKINLLDGKHHLKHTHGGDFRIAVIRAVYQALENNNCIILEPLYKYKIRAHKDYSGKIMSDILKMNGNFNEPIIEGDKVIIEGEVPAATSMEYPVELAAFTSGKAVISMGFSRYEKCHNENEVLDNFQNKIFRDESLYNSISLFREKRKMKKVTN